MVIGPMSLAQSSKANQRVPLARELNDGIGLGHFKPFYELFRGLSPRLA